MIKDILQSNMQLREEQLSLSEAQNKAEQENYQLKIENEDLRDRLHLLTQEKEFTIDYQAYLPVLNLQNIVDSCRTKADLSSARSLILTYIFSLKKENRNLHKRLAAKGPSMNTTLKEYSSNFSDFKQAQMSSSLGIKQKHDDLVEFDDSGQQLKSSQPYSPDFNSSNSMLINERDQKPPVQMFNLLNSEEEEDYVSLPQIQHKKSPSKIKQASGSKYH